MDRKETELETLDAEELSRPSVESAARTATLLSQGDALYRQGLFQRAIHFWTRVLFVDRGNDEARKRIEKAKNALAERDRLLDARVAEARRFLDGGAIEQARDGVRGVLTDDPKHIEAGKLLEDIAVLDRRGQLDDAEVPTTVGREETTTGAAAGAGMRAGTVVSDIGSHRASTASSESESESDFSGDASAVAPGGGLLVRVSRARRRRIAPHVASQFQMAAFLCVVGLIFAAGALFLHSNWDAIVSDGIGAHPSNASPGYERRGPTPPGLAELRYYNGARLFEKKRYREALAELERVGRDSVVAAEARSLILRIEERLLRGVPDKEEGASGLGPEPDAEEEPGR